MNKGMKKKYEELNKKFKEIKKDLGRFEKDTVHKVRDYPIQSIAIAFGAGAVAGALITTLFGRRR